MQKYFGVLLIICLCFGVAVKVVAQGVPFPPPREINVFTTQDLVFGEFYPGGVGGSIIVGPTGTRSSTGTVVLTGGFGQPAIFIIELLPGRLVHIHMSPPTTMLYRSGGGGSMSMNIGPTNKGQSFVTQAGHPFRNPVMVGGTLHVGNIASNPAGEYNGTFSVTFIQE